MIIKRSEKIALSLNDLIDLFIIADESAKVNRNDCLGL